VFGLYTPWFVDQLFTATAYCPNAQHEVTLQLLACGGWPVSVVGCSQRGCSMSCVEDAGASGPAAEPE
jgi:hypothetical protein